MKELLRTTDPVFLSWAQAALRGEHIESVVFDTHASIIEGSISAIPRRLMVIDEDYPRARRIIEDLDHGFRKGGDGGSGGAN